jgi:uncharacterized membrane protein (GlpM family)
LFIIKLLTVPIFIILVTLAGKKWGSEFAGTLGGFPIVAGPIIFFLTLEQGIDFGINASISAIYGTIGLLVFGLIYGWCSQRFHPIICTLISFLAWLITAFSITLMPTNIYWAVGITLFFLLLIPKLLPIIEEQAKPKQNLNDLPLRVLVGALLIFCVTNFATDLGQVWSGILSTFPIVSFILAVFTHFTIGKKHVVQIFRGMSKGIYSFITYFIVYASLIDSFTILTSIVIALLVSLAMQFLIQKLHVYVSN